MRTLFHGLSALALGLATCLTASAQTANQNQARDPNQNTANQNQNQAREANQNAANQNNQGGRKVIRGVIAGVTVEGELAIDYRTNRAATAEMTYLTIVGSERDRNRDQNDRDQARNRDQGERNDRDQARNRDQGERNDRDQARNRDQNDRDRNNQNQNDNDRRASSESERHNIYVVWLTPRTQVRRASDRDRNDQNANRGDRNANPGDRNVNDNNNIRDDQNNNVNRSGNTLTVDALEVGDRVDVRFIQRSSAGDNANQNMASRRHGRHRTYYGEAVSITILSEPGQNDGDRDSNRDQNQNRDRNQDNSRDNDRDD